MKRLILITVTVLFLTTPAWARDVYVMKISATGAALPNTGGHLQQVWEDELLVHNAGGDPATVTLLSASNGVDTSAAEPLIVDPGRTTTRRGSGWPGSVSPFFVEHLDVPDSVAIISTLNPGILFIPSAPPSSITLIGKVPLPVFSQLVPAGQEQFLFNASIDAAPGRLNLAIYNAGSAPAAVLVELVDACDDVIKTSLTFVIAADTITMVGNLGPRPSCPSGTIAVASGTYLRITSDQPGFAVATAIINRSDMTVPIQMAVPAAFQ